MNGKVCDVLLRILASAGVRRMYGIPGDAINELVDAVRRQERIRFVQVRHEEAGALAASAEGKLHGSLGVCVGTAGPGAIHLLNGLYDAKLDASPVLAITGQVPTSVRGTSYHQEVGLQALFQDVAVFQATVTNPEQLPQVAALACQAALQRRGVAHISLPEDVAGKSLPVGVPVSDVVLSEAESVPGEHDVARAVDLIDACERPTILAGFGCDGGRRELVEFAEKIGAPVVSTLRAKDILPDDHALAAGGLGLLGTKPGVRAVESCDLLILAGTDFPYRDFYPKGTPAVQIDLDPSRLGRRHPVAAGLAGHVRPTLELLSGRVRPHGNRAHLERAREEMDKWRCDAEEAELPGEPPLRPQALARRVSDAARQDAIFVCDTGTVTVWGARHVRIRDGQRFLLSSGLGTMGFALPGAIGAQLASPERQVIALAGDGGLGMFLGEFLTAVKYGLPVKVVVFNNRKLGLIQMEQEASGLPEYETALQDLDFGAFARLCGGGGARVRTATDLDDALHDALSDDVPWIVDVEVHADELTMPPRLEAGQMVGFGMAMVKEALGKGDREGGVRETVDRLRS